MKTVTDRFLNYARIDTQSRSKTIKSVQNNREYRIEGSTFYTGNKGKIVAIFRTMFVS